MKRMVWLTCLTTGVYLVACVGLYFGQNMLVFPAHMVTHSETEQYLSITTNEGHTLVLIRDKQADCDVLYFGGNAEAPAASLGELERTFKQCNILSMVYRGYGKSDGTPSQEHFFVDALALYNMRQKHARQSIVIGRSLGAAIATYLAAQVPVRQLILVTPFDSLHHLAREKFPWLPTGLMLKNHFPSDVYARSITAPVHIILAEEDEIIPPHHTMALQAAFVRTQSQLTRLEKVGHNTVDEHSAYLTVLGRMM